jgi:hypothetical protein
MFVHRLLIVAVTDPTNDFAGAHVVLANVSENIPDLFQIGGGRLTMESAVWRLVRIAQQYCFWFMGKADGARGPKWRQGLRLF